MTEKTPNNSEKPMEVEEQMGKLPDLKELLINLIDELSGFRKNTWKQIEQILKPIVFLSAIGLSSMTTANCDDRNAFEENDDVVPEISSSDIMEEIDYAETTIPSCPSNLTPEIISLDLDSTYIEGRNQQVAKFNISSGDQAIAVMALEFSCEGEYAQNMGADNNAFTILTDENFTTAGFDSSCLDGTRVYIMDPQGIAPDSDGMDLTIEYDTSADAGAAIGEDLTFRLKSIDFAGKDPETDENCHSNDVEVDVPGETLHY